MPRVKKKVCLLCFKNISSSLKNGNIRKIQVVALYELVQQCKGSLIHDNAINHPDCDLCELCVDLTEDARAVSLQIVQLQSILREMVVLIRARVLNSEGKEVLQSVGDPLLAIRQTLLLLSSEDGSDDNKMLVEEDDVQVKLEIEDDIEDEDDALHHLFLDPCSPSSFMLDPEVEDAGHFKEEAEEENCLQESEDSEMIEKRTVVKARPVGRKRKSECLKPNKQSSLKRCGRPRKAHLQKQRKKTVDKTRSEPSSESWEETEYSDFDEAKKLKCSSCAKTFPSRETLSTHIQQWHKYPCSSCDQRFRTQKSRTSHTKAKHRGLDSRQFKCSICPHGFNNEEALSNHFSRRHEQNYSCLVCNESFSLKSVRDRHVRVKHKDVPLHPCTMCPSQFSFPGHLAVHMVMKHETEDDKPLSCEKCEKRFTLQINLSRHLQLHKFEDAKPIVCEVCDSRFEDTPRLEQHCLTHEKKRYRCEVCSKRFSTSTSLKVHKRIHTGEKPWKCDHCEEVFIDSTRKQYHIAKMHSTPEQLYLCTICGKRLLTVTLLKTHVERHAGILKKVECDLCGEKFGDTTNLKVHCIKEHGHDPFVCEECGQKFMLAQFLRRHKTVHTGERPHKCDICGATFRALQSLVVHMSYHSEERPHLCSQCGKGFKIKNDLEIHVTRIHKEDFVVKTPHLCSYCGKAYPRKGFLDNHVRQAHTGERPFVCEVCNKGFAVSASLKLHMKSSHGINESKRAKRLPRSKRDEFPPEKLAKVKVGQDK